MGESQKAANVLLVDDDRIFTEDLKSFLSGQFHMKCVHSGPEAVQMARAERPDLVLLDIDLGCEPNGYAVLELLRSGPNPPPVIMLTGTQRGDIASVVRSVKSGAYDYVNKPPNLVELVQRMERCLAEESLRREVKALQRKVMDLEGRMVCEDEASFNIVRDIEKIAPTNVSVLISGETGTGKEVLAREIHRKSKRAEGPFEAVNCRMFTDTLAASEIVGHVRGAFTEAAKDRRGAVANAAGGTLFLDEIGHASKDVQGRLLRILEERKYRPLGTDVDLEADIRLISATNIDLKEAIEADRFGSDLFYRLGAFHVEIPPLRERKGDILPQAEYFLRRFAKEHGRVIIGFSDSAKETMLSYRWEGNTRELRNLVERAVIFCEGEVIRMGDLYSGVGGRKGLPKSYKEAKAEVMRQFKRNFFLPVLREVGGDESQAAMKLGMPLNVLKRHLMDAGVIETI